MSACAELSVSVGTTFKASGGSSDVGEWQFIFPRDLQPAYRPIDMLFKFLSDDFDVLYSTVLDVLKIGIFKLKKWLPAKLSLFYSVICRHDAGRACS